MRQVTATEKLRAVNEGKMAKTEFVRQMRQSYPMYISQYNQFDDTVQILKNRGMLFEEYKNPSKNLSDDSIRRGLDVELTSMGLDPATCSDGEAIAKAKAKAIANIEKDPLYYYNLLSNESSKVDKNDKMKETKRGALEKDTFNDMKKATLKERKERLVEGTRALVGFLSGDRLTTTYNHYDGYPSGLGKGLMTHYNNDDLAKDIAMKGYITGMDPDTGEISQTHNDPPKKIVLDDDAEQRAREIAEEIDGMGADYGYLWDDESNQWITIKNTGIRSMIDQMIDKLSMMNVYSGDKMNEVPAEEAVVEPTLKETLGGIVAFLKSKGAKNDSIKDFIRTHKDDIQGMSMDDVEDEYNNFLSVNTDYVDETDAYDNDEETQDMIDKMRKDGKDADDFVDEKKGKLNEEGIEEADYPMEEAFKRYGIDISKDVIVAEMDGGTAGLGGGQLDVGEPEPAAVVAKRFEKHRLATIAEYEAEKAKYSSEFPVQYEDGFYGDYTPKGTEHKLTYSEFDGTMWDIFQAPSGVSEKTVNEDVDSFSDVIQVVGVETVEDALEVIEKYENEFNDGPVSLDQAKELVADLRATDEDAHDKNITNLIVKAFNIKLKGVSEKKVTEDAKQTNFSSDEIKSVSFPNGLSVTVGQPHPEEEGIVNFIRKGENGYEIGFVDGSEGGSYAVDFNGEFLDEDDYIEENKATKDHDGDGEVESKEDEYKGVKDKAIKKAMGKKANVNEAVKNIITKVLEEKVLSEAATNDLAKIADEYGDFEGLKPAVIALENVVTEIESFYDKTRSKIQKIYNDLGEIRNEEGLKVGAFIAPSIENAFKRDLRPIIKQQFHGGLEMPKVKRISQADVDRGYIQQEAPKETVFTPVNENKKK